MPETVTSVDTSLDPREFAARAGRTAIEFPEGLPGLESHTVWQLVAHEDAEPFLWMESLGSPSLRLLVVDPRAVVADYAPGIRRRQLGPLGRGDGDRLVLLAVVTLRSEGRSTINLRAPIVIDAETMRGRQIILDSDAWRIDHPIGSG